MRCDPPRRRRPVTALTLAIAALALLAPSSAAGAAAGCSQATAEQLVTEQQLNSFRIEQPVVDVLCGSFTGPGSQAMAVTLNAPTCWSPQGWVVFTVIGDRWTLVFRRDLEFLAGPLVAVGSDIRETTPVHRDGDPRCVPGGGTRSRVWHWDGTRFAASADTVVTPAKPRLAAAIVFSPPPARLSCQMNDDGTASGAWVYCWVGTNGRRTPRVRMGLDGRLNRTHRQALPRGLGGPSLAYGKRVSVGRFRCQSQRSGLKCTVIESGKGFLFNRRGATSVRT